jgi:hypothetical protein
MKVGAKFWPERTIWLISEAGRRQRSADFAFSRARQGTFIKPLCWASSWTLPARQRLGVGGENSGPRVRYSTGLNCLRLRESASGQGSLGALALSG